MKRKWLLAALLGLTLAVAGLAYGQSVVNADAKQNAGCVCPLTGEELPCLCCPVGEEK